MTRGEWKTIDSAPKDESPFLAGFEGNDFFKIIHWEANWFWGPAWTDGLHSYRPSHWQHLPEPPEFANGALAP